MIVPLEHARPSTVSDLHIAPSNILAVASGKGGVGKTWFSITLSHAMALAGKRALLFDGDLGLANVDVQLGITPTRDLGTVLAGQAGLAEATTTYAAGGFDILAGRSGSGSLASIAPSKMLQLRTDLRSLAEGYDWVIMDMGAGVERTVRSMAAEARTCIIVTTDEPTAITDAYAFIKLTAMDRPDADIRIVVNLASSIREGERTFGILLKACREFLKLEPSLGGIVRRDPHVRESIRKQTSLLTRYPNTEAALDVQAIAKRLQATA
ncbi:MAG TPA: MinD/ParA family protein [Stellaceae bacterium]|nr:MinD/ParA family protein [Stellaceae bacterium]